MSKPIIYYSVYPEKYKHWFHHLRWPDTFSYVCSDDRPDIFMPIIKSSKSHANTSFKILGMRIKHGSNLLIIGHTSENTAFPDQALDFCFSYKSSNKNNCLMNVMASSMRWERFQSHFKSQWQNLTETNSRQKDFWKEPRLRFCNFIQSNNYGVSWQREKFCALLSQYKRVDCPGKRMNNMPRIGGYFRSGGIKEKLDFIGQCKFTIAFENSLGTHYVTEKLPDALYAGSVPIYWGSPRVAEYYNPESFINCHDYSSLEEVVERVIEVDNNLELYKQYRDAQPVLPNSRLYQIRIEVEEHCANIVKHALEYRTRQRNSVHYLVALKTALFVYIDRCYHLCRSLYSYRRVAYRMRRLLFNIFKAITRNKK